MKTNLKNAPYFDDRKFDNAIEYSSACNDWFRALGKELRAEIKRLKKESKNPETPIESAGYEMVAEKLSEVLGEQGMGFFEFVPEWFLPACALVLWITFGCGYVIWEWHKKHGH